MFLFSKLWPFKWIHNGFLVCSCCDVDALDGHRQTQQMVQAWSILKGTRRGIHTQGHRPLSNLNAAAPNCWMFYDRAKSSETAVGHESEAAGSSPASPSSQMNVAVLLHGCRKSRAMEVISVTYFSGSGLPGIANARRIQDTAGVKAEFCGLDSSTRNEPS